MLFSGEALQVFFIVFETVNEESFESVIDGALQLKRN